MNKNRFKIVNRPAKVKSEKPIFKSRVKDLAKLKRMFIKDGITKLKTKKREDNLRKSLPYLNYNWLSLGKQKLMRSSVSIHILNAHTNVHISHTNTSKNINSYCKIVHFFIKGSKSRKNSKTKITRRFQWNNLNSVEKAVAKAFGLSAITMGRLHNVFGNFEKAVLVKTFGLSGIRLKSSKHYLIRRQLQKLFF